MNQSSTARCSMVTATGHICWSQLLVTAAGQSYWSQLLVTAAGHSIWSQVLVTAAGHMCCYLVTTFEFSRQNLGDYHTEKRLIDCEASRHLAVKISYCHLEFNPEFYY